MHRFSWHRSLSPPLRSVARSLCHEKHYLTLLNCFLKSWSHIIDKNTPKNIVCKVRLLAVFQPFFYENPTEKP